MRNRSLWLPIAALLVGLLALGGLFAVSLRAVASETPSTGEQLIVAHGVTQVFIHNETFQPASIEVAPGTIVTWTNQDSIFHTVTIASTMVSTQNVTASGQLSSRGSFSYTFMTRGTFTYYCSDHQSAMKGTIIVI